MALLGFRLLAPGTVRENNFCRVQLPSWRSFGTAGPQESNKLPRRERRERFSGGCGIHTLSQERGEGQRACFPWKFCPRMDAVGDSRTARMLHRLAGPLQEMGGTFWEGHCAA